jgi:drug/metabolite transporter (DMT)-like permease
MIHMTFAILFSAVLTLIFKWFSQWRVNTFHAIVVNYFVAVLCGVLATGKLPYQLDGQTSAAWTALAIGCLFIFGFNVLAQTVQRFGVTFGTLLQKMSVLLTVIYAIVYFRESLGMVKAIGILLALISIWLVTHKKRGVVPIEKLTRSAWHLLLPTMTFVSSGMIDSLFLTGKKLDWISGTDIVFISSTFFTAGVIGLILWLSVASIRRPPSRRSILAGIILGIPNFFSIYFLLKILDMGWDGSIVFPIFNVGVLLVAAMGSWAIFKEKITVMKLVGVFVAAVSIYLISASL